MIPVVSSLYGFELTGSRDVHILSTMIRKMRVVCGGLREAVETCFSSFTHVTIVAFVVIALLTILGLFVLARKSS